MVDITKGTHKWGFLNKVASAQTGSPHIYNIILKADHDNFDMAVRGDWKAFDQYEEDTATAVSFSGIVREKTPEGNWYIEVVSSNALLLYNSPVSPYAEKEFQDESLFVNKTNDRIQGFSLIEGDVFSVNPEAFNQTPQSGDAVTYVNGVYTI